MQVSDLNSNLLKMIAGATGSKQENDSEQVNFLDLLRASSGSEECVINNQNLAEGKKEGFLSRVEEKQVKVAEPEVKKVKMSKVKDVQPAQTNAENATASEEKSEIKQSDKPQNKTEQVENKVASQEPSGEGGELPQENQNVEEVNVLAEEIGAMLMPIISSDENTAIIEVADNSLNTGNVEDVLVDGEVAVAEEKILPSLEVDRQEMVAEPIVDIREKNEVEKKNPAVAVNEAEAESLQETKIIPEAKTQEIEAEDVLENVVSEQEKEIAELLPEGKKVEVKVSVEKDTVEVTPQKKNFLQETLDTQEIAQDDSEIVLQTSKENKDVESVSTPIAQASSVQFNEGNQKVINYQKEENVVAISKIENTVQAQAVAPLANEIKMAGNVSETESFNDVYQKGITKEVSEQIKVNITQSAIKGVDKIEIQLKPANLGQVEIKLHIGKNGQLQAHIVASNQETLEIIQKDFESLKDAFNQAGYQADNESFSFSYRGESQENNEREKLREFIGEVLTQEIAEETAANDYISTDGVNIRV